ncbi:hypothetical protein [Azospirillum sp. B2RO_4]|uniref:hypothetical protein n=1 Tax=Azospirillum sp. B2RO_4 TaxID=3027796 RepID=UPI003DA9F705
MIATSRAVEILKKSTHVPEPQIRGMARRLIDEGFLPKSRGRRVAEMDIEQFTLLLLAIHVTAPKKGACEIAQSYFDLEGYHPGSAPFETVGKHIAAALRAYMENSESAEAHSLWGSISVMIMLAHPYVTVTSLRGTGKTEYGRRSTDEKPQTYVEFPAGTFARIAQLWSAPSASEGEEDDEKTLVPCAPECAP